MSWAAAVPAAYVIGIVVFWRLCRSAPMMVEDTFDDPDSMDEPAEQRDQDPT